jgi:CRP-like cAMP-binding protein
MSLLIPTTVVPPALVANRLLRALPLKEYGRVLPLLEHVSLSVAQVLYERGDKIEHVYFPMSGMISLLAIVDNARSTQVAVVGNEGVAGIPLFLGMDTSANCAIVQGAGVAFRMDATLFLKQSSKGRLGHVLRRYTLSLLNQLSQTAACNHFHSLEARLAFQLLMTQDRMHADEFPLTQEFISNLLGIRREGVNIAAVGLRKRKLISYTRGHITILDRLGLEDFTCECYAILNAHDG